LFIRFGCLIITGSHVCLYSLVVSLFQVAMSVLKTVSAEASEQLQPLLKDILDLCAQTLYDGNLIVPYYTIL